MNKNSRFKKFLSMFMVLALMMQYSVTVSVFAEDGADEAAIAAQEAKAAAAEQAAAEKAAAEKAAAEKAAAEKAAAEKAAAEKAAAEKAAAEKAAAEKAAAEKASTPDSTAAPSEPSTPDQGQEDSQDQPEPASEDASGQAETDLEKARAPDSAEGTEKAIDLDAEEKGEKEEWEKSFTDSSNGLTIKVSAPDGAFKKGTKMVLKPIQDDTAKEMISGAIPDDRVVTDIVGVDVSFRYNGKTIQPDERVTITITGANLTGDNPTLYHKHNGTIDTHTASNNSASFKTNTFSPIILAAFGASEGEEELTEEEALVEESPEEDLQDDDEAPEEETYTVTFLDRDGHVYATVNVAQGEKIGSDIPAVIARDGYTAYWAIGHHDGHDIIVTGERVTADYEVNGDITVVPDYVKTTYTVTFYAEDKTTVVDAKEVSVDTSFYLNDIPDVPKKSGYVGKWVYAGGDFSNTVQINEDTSVWASYDQNVFTVEFKVDGETYQSDTYFKDDELALPAEPVSDGREFKGWFVGETQYNGGEKVNSNLVLTAEFSEMYTVEFKVYDDDGDEIESLSQHFVIREEGEAVGTMPQDPFVSGKIFQKWVNADTKEEITKDTIVTENITAVAVFHEIELYKVTAEFYYLGDDGTSENVFETQIYSLDDSEFPYTITPPASTQTDAEYVAGEPVYYPVNTSIEVDNTGFDENNEKTVRVQYVAYTAKYDVVHMLKNLDGNGYIEIARDENVEGVKGSYVTPEAKTFDYANLELAEGAVITEESGQELKVYYTRKNFSLSYETNGGSYVSGTTVPYGTSVNLPSTNPTRSGYTFEGWYSDPELTKKVTGSVTVNADTVLYANWTGSNVNYTIIYMKEKYNPSGENEWVYENSRTATAQVGSTVYSGSNSVAKIAAPNGYELSSAMNGNGQAAGQGEDTAVVIKEDGSSVVKVYYSLIRYTLIFNINRNDGRITIGGRVYSGSNYRIENVVIGEDISARWPSSTDEIDSPTRWFGGWSGAVLTYITKQYVLDYNAHLTNANSRHEMTFTGNWNGTRGTVTAQYWLQQPDGSYEEDTGLRQTVHASALTNKEINGYTKHSGTPSGYPSSSDNTYRFYYDRSRFKIDYYYGSDRLHTINNVYYEADISGSTYNYTPSRPSDVDSDYTWGGWYADAALAQKYEFGTMPGNNLVLYAKWVAPEYTVNFELDGGAPEFDDQKVEKYQKVQKPAEHPTKTGYTFEGWFTSSDGNELFDWNTQITSDTTIYAHWSQDQLSYTVQYVDEAGNVLAPEKTVTNPNLTVGQIVTEQAITIAGYRPVKTSDEVTLDIDKSKNVITFVYTQKTGSTSYTIHYIIDPDEISGNIKVADSKVVEDISDNTLSVKELAAAVDYASLYAEHPELEGEQFYPAEVEHELVLSANAEENVYTFKYSRFQSTKVTVNYVDMDGKAIIDSHTETLKVGKTFTLARTPISGWELNKAVEGAAYEGAEAGTSYKITHDGSLNFTLFYQKKLTITANSFNKAYDGTALTMPADLASQVAAEGLLDGHRLQSVNLSYSGTDTAADEAKGRINAGVATVTPSAATIAGNFTSSNYYKIRYISGRLEVTKKNVTIRVEPDRWTGNQYNGSEYKTGFTNPTKGKEDYVIISNEEYASKYLDAIWNTIISLDNVTYDASAAGTGYYVIAEKDAGTYTYDLALTTADLPKNDNYSVALYVRPGLLEIAPISEVTVTITGHNAATDYDGEEHSVSGYDVETSNPLYTAEDFTFSGTAEAARTEVGTTNMGLTAEQFTNTNENFGTVTFNVTDGYQTINPINVTVTITGHNNTADYDGEEHSVSGYDVETSNPLYTAEDFTFSGTAEAARTNAGTTNMGLAAEQFTNTNENFGTVTFNVTDGYQTINPINVTVTITGHNNTADYDGAEHSVSGYDVEISNPLYTAEDFTFSGTAEAARTDVGTTNMGLAAEQFTNTNENFGTVTFNVTDGYQTINPINVTVTITGHNNTTTYDGEEHSVSGYDVEISNPLYTTEDFTFSGTAEAARTEVGTTNMGLAAEQFANTNENFGTVTFNVTDGYQTITAVDEVVVTITGHNNTADYDGEEHSVSGYDVEISNPLYTAEDFTFSGTAEAARTNAGTTNMGLAAEQFANTNENFGTVTFNVTDGYQTINPINVTVTITGHNNTADYDGAEHSVSGYDVEISNPLYTEADFTFSGTAEAARTNAGTTNMGLAAEQFANTNENFGTVTFNVTDGYQTINPINVTVTITGHNNTTIYDGAEHSVSGYDVEISNPLYTEADFTFSGTAEAARTNAGTTNMGLAAEQFANKNTNFATVTFNVTDGYQTINPYGISVTSEDKSVVYNGSEQYGNETFRFSNLVDGHTATITYTPSSGTLVGEYDNGSFNKDSLLVVDEGGRDVTENYILTSNRPGKLTITDGTKPGDEPVDPDLVVTKTTEDAKLNLGATATFKITATNIYSEPKTITLSEIAGVTLSQSTFTNVAAGATVEATATYVITEKDIMAGSFTNTVTATLGEIEKQASAEVTTADKKSHVTITKVATSTPADGKAYDLGETISYKITAENDGNLTVTDLVVTDELTGDKWTVEKLAPGDSKEFTTSYVVTEADILEGEVLNVATGRGNGPVPPTVDPGKDPEPTVTPKRHVTITKAATSTPANGEKYDLGETISYKITAENDGNQTVDNLVVSDELTGDSWTVTKLAPGESKEFTTSYVVTEADILKGEVLNVATGTSKDPEPPTIDPGKDPEPTVTPNRHVTITKAATSTPANGKAYDLGETISYKITVLNDGNQTVNNMAVNDELTGDSWTVEKLAPGETKEFTTSYVVTEAEILEGEVLNVATGTSTDPEPPTIVPGTDPEPTVTPVRHVTITKVATSTPANGKAYDLGETISYKITAENDGNQTVNNLVVSDKLTGDSWTVEKLAPGESEEFTTSYVVTEADILEGEVLNVATGTSTDPEPPIIDPGKDPEPTVEPKSHVTITKAAASTPANGEAYDLGETISYKITALNDGNQTATNLVVTDELTGDKWTVEKLAPGESKEFTTSYVVTEADVLNGTVLNVATGTADGPVPPTVDPGKDPEPTVKPNGHITITKTTTSSPASGTAYREGETITYRIVAANDGNVTLTNVTVTDDLTGDRWPIASMAPGTSRTFTATHVVTAADVAAGRVRNVATATGTSPDPDHPTPTVVPGTKDDPTEPTPTPPTPPTPTPTPTPTPGGGGGGPAVTPAGPAPVPAPAVIDDGATPAAEPEPIEIDDEDTPLAQGAWALVNLICAALATLGAAVALFRKKEDEDEDEDDEEAAAKKAAAAAKAADGEEEDEEDNRARNMTIAKVLGALTAIASIVAFILTEDMSLPMIMTDKWTLLMALLFAGQIGTAVANKKASETDDDDDEDGTEGAEGAQA